jgi:hypothetical protein
MGKLRSQVAANLLANLAASSQLNQFFVINSTLLKKMFRALVVLASIISAAAFAPVARRMASSSLKMSYESELGVVGPTGFFDPLGKCNNDDDGSIE